MNKNIIFGIATIISLGIGVSLIKYEVVALRKHLCQLKSEIEKNSDELKVLGAEWSLLNDPKRLKKLASKHLPQMKPMVNGQILSYSEFVKTDYEDQRRSRRKEFDSFIDSVL